MGGAISTYAHFEQMQKGLETFFQDADKGKQKFEELRKLSNTTTFGVDELARSFTELANVGVNVDTINDQLVMLGNIAGGDKTKFAELVTLYSKIQSTGKAGAMQLQQIASRGVPIYDILKKIGVQGTATGADIQKAFQEMTKEGGQFYNAMNNINDTIEGKEGFISDYFRELTVNFVEITGIAKTYKSVLDQLKKVIGDVSDKLLEWNENPAMKALFSGALVAIISGLVTLITTSLIAALRQVIASLVQINILSGPAGWTALAIAGITGVITYVHSYKSALKEVEEQEKKLGNIQPKISPFAGMGENDIGAYSKQRIEDAKKMLKDLKEQETSLKQTLSLSDLNKGTAFELPRGLYKDIQKDLSSVLAEQKKLTSEQDYFNKVLQGTEVLSSNIKEAHKSQYKNDLEYLQAEINQLNEYKKIGTFKVSTKDSKGNPIVKMFQLNDQDKAEIDLTLKYLEEKKKELAKKLKLEGLTDAQKVLKSAMGITDNQIMSGALDSGDNAIKQYIENLQNKMSNLKSYSNAGLIDISNLDLARAKLDAVNSVLKQMRDSGKQYDEEIIKGMTDLQSSAVNDVYTAQTEELQKQIELIKQGTTEYEKQKEIKSMMSMGYSLEQATELYNLQKDFNNELLLQTDIWDALTQKSREFFENIGLSSQASQTLGDAVTTIAKQSLNGVVNSFQAIGKALAQGANSGEALKQVFLQTVQQMLSSLSIACITAGVQLIAQSGWAGVPPALALFALGGVAGIGSGVISAFTSSSASTQEQQNELELLKQLNQQYKSLRDAMQEQEEYYLKKRRELNANTYKSEITGVHDMILTPQGNFSTDPDDYIIASKNPASLGGSANVSIVVNNTMAQSADVNIQRNNSDGQERFIIQISQKVASDFASGKNGWDDAYSYRQMAGKGRILAL